MKAVKSAAAVWSVGFTRVKDYSPPSSLSSRHADRNGHLSQETKGVSKSKLPDSKVNKLQIKRGHTGKQMCFTLSDLKAKHQP